MSNVRQRRITTGMTGVRRHGLWIFVLANMTGENQAAEDFSKEGWG
ncbi:hypothetical protein F5X71_03450 [Nocardia brasiliensis]|uniref:Uncharacterized protein n=1 Tax=Nocardia brasiliensis TaxID=37326 RepID=A0A6G9XKQ7_NOCBR|nr:hypothetical protein [Nocardia brasiliensis]QIS01497.1 hypothetical protein F5X71_03450 [Nocardia brasiliensis]